MGVFYINGVNSMPFVKKCENTLDKITRSAPAFFFFRLYSPVSIRSAEAILFAAVLIRNRTDIPAFWNIIPVDKNKYSC